MSLERIEWWNPWLGQDFPLSSLEEELVSYDDAQDASSNGYLNAFSRQVKVMNTGLFLGEDDL